MHLDNRVNGTTILTGLIGNPVEHTVSPLLHNSLFSEIGINGIYIPLKTPEGSLREVVNSLRLLGFAGFNVTIPYKEQIIDFIDEISDDAKLFGAVNTVKSTEGKLIGYNTDADGFVRAFREQTGTGFYGKKVCILGAGGTARSIAVKILTEDAATLCIINRTAVKAKELASELSKLTVPDKITGTAGSNSSAGCCGTTVFAASSGSIMSEDLLSSSDIVINTTSAGMYPNISDSPIKLGFKFKKEQIVYDVIYNPVRTKLMADAEACGCKTCNGAGMLFFQGLRAFEIWNGLNVPANVTDKLLKEFLKYLNF